MLSTSEAEGKYSGAFPRRARARAQPELPVHSVHPYHLEHL